MQVEVLSIKLPPQNRSRYTLAVAEVQLTLTGHLGNNYSFLIRDIGVVPDSMPGEYSFTLPKFKHADSRPEPTILVSWHVRKAIADALIPAFKKWQAEQAQNAATNAAQSQQTGGAR